MEKTLRVLKKTVRPFRFFFWKKNEVDGSQNVVVGMEQVVQIKRKRGRPSKEAVAAAKAAAEEEAASKAAKEVAAAAAAAAAAEELAAEELAAAAAAEEVAAAAAEEVVPSVTPAKRLCRRGKKEKAAAEEESDKESTIVAIGEVVPESRIEREDMEWKMQAYEMEAKVNALVSERIFEIRDEIADELIGSTEIRDAIANELIGCMTALLERTTRAIADRYNNEHRPLEHWIDR